MAKKKKLLILSGIIVVALAVIIGVGFFAYQKFWLPDANQNHLAKDLIGSWVQTFETVSPDEALFGPNCNPDSWEIKFNEDGTYESWLHCRPAESGTWVLNGNIITFNNTGDSYNTKNFYTEKVTINADNLNLGPHADFKRIKY
jgi:hypothetical protein